MTLPKRQVQPVTDADAMTDADAIEAVRSAVLDLGWVFRPFAGTTDNEIDGEIEVREEESPITGATVRVQVKGSSSPSEIAKGVSVKTSTIRYWLASPLPVFMIRVTDPKAISILHVESYLTEHRKLEFIQDTAQKTFKFKFDAATRLPEYVDVLRDVALEHQAAILDISKYSLYNSTAQMFGYYRLVHHHKCDIEAMLQDMRKNAPDDRLTYDYGAAVLLKKQLEEHPAFIEDIKKLVEMMGASQSKPK